MSEVKSRWLSHKQMAPPKSRNIIGPLSDAEAVELIPRLTIGKNTIEVHGAKKKVSMWLIIWRELDEGQRRSCIHDVRALPNKQSPTEVSSLCVLKATSNHFTWKKFILLTFSLKLAKKARENDSVLEYDVHVQNSGSFFLTIAENTQTVNNNFQHNLQKRQWIKIKYNFTEKLDYVTYISHRKQVWYVTLKKYSKEYKIQSESFIAFDCLFVPVLRTCIELIEQGFSEHDQNKSERNLLFFFLKEKSTKIFSEFHTLFDKIICLYLSRVEVWDLHLTLREKGNFKAICYHHGRNFTSKWCFNNEQQHKCYKFNHQYNT